MAEGEDEWAGWVEGPDGLWVHESTLSGGAGAAAAAAAPDDAAAEPGTDDNDANNGDGAADSGEDEWAGWVEGPDGLWVKVEDAEAATPAASGGTAAAEGVGEDASEAQTNEGAASGAAQAKIPWERVLTDDGTAYFYNAETEESAWELPQGFALNSEGVVEAVSPSSSGGDETGAGVGIPDGGAEGDNLDATAALEAADAGDDVEATAAESGGADAKEAGGRVVESSGDKNAKEDGGRAGDAGGSKSWHTASYRGLAPDMQETVDNFVAGLAFGGHVYVDLEPAEGGGTVELLQEWVSYFDPATGGTVEGWEEQPQYIAAVKLVIELRDAVRARDWDTVQDIVNRAEEDGIVPVSEAEVKEAGEVAANHIAIEALQTALASGAVSGLSYALDFSTVDTEALEETIEVCDELPGMAPRLRTLVTVAKSIRDLRTALAEEDWKSAAVAAAAVQSGAPDVVADELALARAAIAHHASEEEMRACLAACAAATGADAAKTAETTNAAMERASALPGMSEDVADLYDWCGTAVAILEARARDDAQAAREAVDSAAEEARDSDEVRAIVEGCEAWLVEHAASNTGDAGKSSAGVEPSGESEPIGATVSPFGAAAAPARDDTASGSEQGGDDGGSAVAAPEPVEDPKEVARSRWAAIKTVAIGFSRPEESSGPKPALLRVVSNVMSSSDRLTGRLSPTSHVPGLTAVISPTASEKAAAAEAAQQAEDERRRRAEAVALRADAAEARAIAARECVTDLRAAIVLGMATGDPCSPRLDEIDLEAIDAALERAVSLGYVAVERLPHTPLFLRSVSLRRRRELALHDAHSRFGDESDNESEAGGSDSEDNGSLASDIGRWRSEARELRAESRHLAVWAARVRRLRSGMLWGDWDDAHAAADVIGAALDELRGGGKERALGDSVRTSITWELSWAQASIRYHDTVAMIAHAITQGGPKGRAGFIDASQLSTQDLDDAIAHARSWPYREVDVTLTWTLARAMLVRAVRVSWRHRAFYDVQTLLIGQFGVDSGNSDSDAVNVRRKAAELLLARRSRDSESMPLEVAEQLHELTTWVPEEVMRAATESSTVTQLAAIGVEGFGYAELALAWDEARLRCALSDLRAALASGGIAGHEPGDMDVTSVSIAAIDAAVDTLRSLDDDLLNSVGLARSGDGLIIVGTPHRDAEGRGDGAESDASGSVLRDDSTAADDVEETSDAAELLECAMLVRSLRVALMQQNWRAVERVLASAAEVGVVDEARDEMVAARDELAYRVIVFSLQTAVAHEPIVRGRAASTEQLDIAIARCEGLKCAVPRCVHLVALAKHVRQLRKLNLASAWDEAAALAPPDSKPWEGLPHEASKGASGETVDLKAAELGVATGVFDDDDRSSSLSGASDALESQGDEGHSTNGGAADGAEGSEESKGLEDDGSGAKQVVSPASAKRSAGAAPASATPPVPRSRPVYAALCQRLRREAEALTAAARRWRSIPGIVEMLQQAMADVDESLLCAGLERARHAELVRGEVNFGRNADIGTLEAVESAHAQVIDARDRPLEEDDAEASANVGAVATEAMDARTHALVSAALRLLISLRRVRQDLMTARARADQQALDSALRAAASLGLDAERHEFVRDAQLLSKRMSKVADAAVRALQLADPVLAETVIRESKQLGGCVADDVEAQLKELLAMDEDDLYRAQIQNAKRYGNTKAALKATMAAKRRFLQEHSETFAFHRFPALRSPREFGLAAGADKDAVLAGWGMLTHTTAPIKTSLTRQPAERSALAAQAFRSVLGFMGDRPSTNRTALATALLHVGVAVPELRDELFCQVVKQLTKNPNDKSVRAGWVLLYLLLDAFPPSQQLENYLELFLLTKLRTAHVRVLHRTVLRWEDAQAEAAAGGGDSFIGNGEGDGRKASTASGTPGQPGNSAASDKQLVRRAAATPEADDGGAVLPALASEEVARRIAVAEALEQAHWGGVGLDATGTSNTLAAELVDERITTAPSPWLAVRSPTKETNPSQSAVDDSASLAEGFIAGNDSHEASGLRESAEVAAKLSLYRRIRDSLERPEWFRTEDGRLSLGGAALSALSGSPQRGDASDGARSDGGASGAAPEPLGLGLGLSLAAAGPIAEGVNLAERSLLADVDASATRVEDEEESDDETTSKPSTPRAPSPRRGRGRAETAPVADDFALSTPGRLARRGSALPRFGPARGRVGSVLGADELEVSAGSTGSSDTRRQGARMRSASTVGVRRTPRVRTVDLSRSGSPTIDEGHGGEEPRGLSSAPSGTWVRDRDAEGPWRYRGKSVTEAFASVGASGAAAGGISRESARLRSRLVPERRPSAPLLRR